MNNNQVMRTINEVMKDKVFQQRIKLRVALAEQARIY
jgi:cellulose biosynthesis protein BcsQ